MGLRIIRAYEPIEVKRAIVTLYGGPGMRKTTIANTAESPLIIDFDEGAHRAGINRRPVLVQRGLQSGHLFGMLREEDGAEAGA